MPPSTFSREKLEEKKETPEILPPTNNHYNIFIYIHSSPKDL